MSSQISLCIGMGLAVLLLAGPACAEDNLPSVRQLIAEALALCDADREENAEALDSLAEAQCYLGDFGAARKTLSLVNSTDLRLAHFDCAKIEIESTGSVASIPDAYWKNDRGILRCKAALAFIRRGEIEKALEQIDQIPVSAVHPLNVFGADILRKLKEQKENQARRKVALAWASRLNRAEEITSYLQHYEVSQLVACLVELGERPAATALCDHWLSILKAQSNITQRGGLVGKDWARYAHALAALDKEAASSALDQAFEWVEKWRESERYSARPGLYRNLALAYAAIAARQAVIFDADRSKAAYGQAYESARRSIDVRDPRFGDFAYEMIVSEQLEAGDLQGAKETMKRAPSLRSAARCCLRMSTNALARGHTESARAAALAAFQILNKGEFETFVAEDMALVASNSACAGEMEMGRKLFERALALSNADKSPKSMHPFIATFQAESGLFADAYATIQTILKPSDRTRPLAHLCLALAKAESLNRGHRP